MSDDYTLEEKREMQARAVEGGKIEVYEVENGIKFKNGNN